MNKELLLKLVDHTLLSQTATEKDILMTVDDAIKYNTATVCIPNCYVKAAAEHSNGRMKIVTLAGFPNGNITTKVKCADAFYAIEDGASEIDMVANLGMLRSGNYKYVLDEIVTVKKVCDKHILKVIIETCLLSKDEKIEMCKIVSQSGADFIKTSTGFSTGGATFEDIALFAANVRSGLGIKAAGGIRSFEDAQKFVDLGATRLGTSALVKLMKCEEPRNY